MRQQKDDDRGVWCKCGKYQKLWKYIYPERRKYISLKEKIYYSEQIFGKYLTHIYVIRVTGDDRDWRLSHCIDWEILHKYWTNICGILGKYLVNFGKYLSNIGSIFGKYLWDQRVRADDRDWLLWAELLFGSDNRTGLPLLKHIVVLFIIVIIIIIIIIVVVVIIIFIIFTTIKSWFWLPPNMPFLSGALLFAALVVHRNEVCTKRNLYKDCVTTKKHHSC